MTNVSRWLSVVVMVGCLSACVQNDEAPVIDGWLQPSAHPQSYRVRTGDTLYSIAWNYGLDYRVLAAHNHLSVPYAIHPGQLLWLKVQATPATPVSPVPNPVPATTPEIKPYTTTRSILAWRWPVRGTVLSRFSRASGGNKGIDISGYYGQAVLAAASGEVVYSGFGVRGYGNLIIIKHSESYLSAYAFNKRILVREGVRVRAGQKIAEMGRDDSGRVMLHFEIRRDGYPINPLRYLP